MILFTSSTQNIAAPTSGGWSFSAIVREMLNSWPVSYTQQTLPTILLV